MIPPRAFWRRLLQLDDPVPQYAAGELDAFISRHYRWNFLFTLLDGASFWLGVSLISTTTIVPLFISKLSDSTLLLGVAAMISQGGWFLPQLLAANVTERIPSRKAVVVNLGFFTERLPLLLIVAAAAIALTRPALALLLFFLGLGAHTVGGGVVAPAWQDLVARQFPVDRRGRLLGVTTALGTAIGIGGAALSARLLDQLPFPTSFAWIFGLGTAAIFVSWAFLTLVREPVQRGTRPRQSERHFFADLPRLLATDHNFRHFLVARVLLALSVMGLGFVTVTAVNRWDIPDSQVGIYTATMLVGQTVGTLLFGFLADRFGHKVALEWSGVATGLGFLVVWLAPDPSWMPLAFALLGVRVAAILVSGILVVLEFAPPERRPTYVGLANTVVGVASLIGPLLGAWLANRSEPWLYGLSALAAFAGFAVMWLWVDEPRWALSAQPIEVEG